jgi:DNA-binding CsgD family transcriptional regulator
VLRDLVRSATTEVLACRPYGGRFAATLRRTRRADDETLRRGVAGYVVCERGWIEDAVVANELRARIDAGAHVRVVDRLPHWLAVVDRDVALVPVHPLLTAPGAHLVTDRDEVAGLRSAFAAIWRAASEFPHVGPGSEACTPRDRAVLEFLNRGVTDESAAKQMAVSVRTYRRYVAELMMRLGAECRFQAGVLAVEAGWL